MKQMLMNRRVAMRLGFLSIGLLGARIFYSHKEDPDKPEVQQIEPCIEYHGCMDDLSQLDTQIIEANKQLVRVSEALDNDLLQINMRRSQWGDEAKTARAKGYAESLQTKMGDQVRVDFIILSYIFGGLTVFGYMTLWRSIHAKPKIT